MAEIKYVVIVALPKLFKLDQQSRQEALKGYCSNIYTAGVSSLGVPAPRFWQIPYLNQRGQIMPTK